MLDEQLVRVLGAEVDGDVSESVSEVELTISACVVRGLVAE